MRKVEGSREDRRREKGSRIRTGAEPLVFVFMSGMQT